jgi:hypothetical protein
MKLKKMWEKKQNTQNKNWLSLLPHCHGICLILVNHNVLSDMLFWQVKRKRRDERENSITHSIISLWLSIQIIKHVRIYMLLVFMLCLLHLIIIIIIIFMFTLPFIFILFHVHYVVCLALAMFNLFFALCIDTQWLDLTATFICFSSKSSVYMPKAFFYFTFSFVCCCVIDFFVRL